MTGQQPVGTAKYEVEEKDVSKDSFAPANEVFSLSRHYEKKDKKRRKREARKSQKEEGAAIKELAEEEVVS